MCGSRCSYKGLNISIYKFDATNTPDACKNVTTCFEETQSRKIGFRDLGPEILKIPINGLSGRYVFRQRARVGYMMHAEMQQRLKWRPANLQFTSSPTLCMEEAT